LALEDKECKSDIKGLKARFHELTLRALAVKRALTVIQRRLKRKATFAKRASDELSSYRKFRAMIKENQKGWMKFWEKAKNNMHKVIEMLHRASKHLQELKEHYKNAALIQLPESYGDALSEIKSQFEETFDNLDGLRPLISSLLEIMRQANHLNKPQVRKHIRNIIRHLIARFSDKINDLDEEHEHQIGLFDALDKLFGDAIDRGEKSEKAIKDALERVEKKVDILKTGVAGIKSLVKSAKNVIDLRYKECRRLHGSHVAQNVRAEKILSVVSELQEVIGERWKNLNTFFTEGTSSLANQVNTK